MRAIVYEEYGAPDVLKLRDVEKPIPGDGEVLIKVHASTAATGDANARGFVFVPKGFKLLARLMFGVSKPKKAILGTEFAGEIAAVGANVSLFRPGDKVFGIDGNNLGAYAEYKRMPETGALVEMPSGFTYEEAAAIPNGALTALHFLKTLGCLHEGQKVLVNGASGSVGLAAVQIAKYFGAKVTGVCSSGNVDLVKSLGADSVIDYTKQDFSAGGQVYDIILDAVGNASFSRCRHSLKHNGQLLQVAGGLPEFLMMFWTSFASSKKVKCGGGTASESKENLMFIRELTETGRFKPVIDKVYPLELADEAHRHLDGGHKRGNIVITV